MKFSELYRLLEENGWVKITAIIEKAFDGGYFRLFQNIPILQCF